MSYTHIKALIEKLEEMSKPEKGDNRPLIVYMNRQMRQNYQDYLTDCHFKMNENILLPDDSLVEISGHCFPMISGYPLITNYNMLDLHIKIQDLTCNITEFVYEETGLKMKSYQHA